MNARYAEIVEKISLPETEIARRARVERNFLYRISIGQKVTDFHALLRLCDFLNSELALRIRPGDTYNLITIPFLMTGKNYDFLN